MPSETDHDLLMRIDERVHGLFKWKDNHSKHHWFIEASLILSVLGLIFAVIKLALMAG